MNIRFGNRSRRSTFAYIAKEVIKSTSEFTEPGILRTIRMSFVTKCQIRGLAPSVRELNPRKEKVKQSALSPGPLMIRDLVPKGKQSSRRLIGTALENYLRNHLADFLKRGVKDCLKGLLLMAQSNIEIKISFDFLVQPFENTLKHLLLRFWRGGSRNPLKTLKKSTPAIQQFLWKRRDLSRGLDSNTSISGEKVTFAVTEDLIMYPKSVNACSDKRRRGPVTLK
ncbi:hypothetical protein EVAR_56276_1 [Eumeta japonica]|uniref:Uncharacterized protein n=1 Tax=Eumeta variegata TaxID=151549 RepID=A0A4C1YKW5_EUMVA|nr:hypothetical protein EVAR_56276_1 [Eumeta japonica]